MVERGCIFCGNTPLTQEHLIPRWAAKVLYTNNPRYPTSGLHYRRGRGQDQDWRATPNKVEFVAKCVCANCNNGWMDKIETAARPFLSPMIRGKEITVGPAASDAIGKWLCLKAMIERYAQADPIPVPEEVRRRFYISQEPPQTWHAWVAYYVGKRPIYYHSGRMNTEYKPPLAPYTHDYIGLSFTLVLGYFAAKVFGISELMPLETGTAATLVVWPRPRLSLEVPQRSEEIWRTWPPPKHLDDELLDIWQQGLPAFG